jgi:hypothetical protein
VNALRAAAARQLRDCWEKMSKPRERCSSRPRDSTRAADLLSDLCIMNALSSRMESVFYICARGAFAEQALSDARDLDHRTLAVGVKEDDRMQGRGVFVYSSLLRAEPVPKATPGIKSQSSSFFN